MPVLDLHENVARSTVLSSYQMPKMIPPLDVIRLLNQNKIRFVLVGAYGLAGWRKEPRGTEDVDVVVAARQVPKAVRILLHAFSGLEAVDLPVVVRLRYQGTDTVAIDVMKPNDQPYRELFKHTESVTVEGEKYRIPTLEMAVVMKYSAMTSVSRLDEDKFQDAHDFILMVKNNPQLDLEKAGKLASLMYPAGAEYLHEMVRKVRAGEKLVL